MTKHDEIQALMELAHKLGANSYCGPWLDSQIPYIEHDIWCADDDRHIVVHTKHERIVGLVYYQGDDAEGLFDAPIDEDLTSFFLAVEPVLTGKTELDRINQAIWAHFEYKAGDNIL